MGDDPNAAWKNKIKWYSENNHDKELNRIDGMQTEFEWYSQDSRPWASSKRFQKMMEGFQCELEHFNERIIFVSMYNDIAWRENGNTETCVQNSTKVAK